MHAGTGSLLPWLAPHLDRAGALGPMGDLPAGLPRPAPRDVCAWTWPLPLPGP